MNSKEVKKLERTFKDLEKAMGLACAAKDFAADQEMCEAYALLAEAHLDLVKAHSEFLQRYWKEVA